MCLWRVPTLVPVYWWTQKSDFWSFGVRFLAEADLIEDSVKKSMVLSSTQRPSFDAFYKIVSVTTQTNNTWSKLRLRVSAFQWYRGLGVTDRVFVVKY